MLSGNPTSSSSATLISNVFLIANMMNAVAGTLSGVENQLTAVGRVRELGELEPGEPAWHWLLGIDCLADCLASWPQPWHVLCAVCVLCCLGSICKSVPRAGRVVR